MIQKKCERCGKAFFIYPSNCKKHNNKYCSWECRYPVIIQTCLTCNKKFRKNPYVLKKGHGKYCSYKCRPPSRLGAKLSQKIKNKISNSHKGKKHTKESKRKIGRKGENNFNWKGGITPFKTLIWQSDKYRQWRQTIFIRDNFTCQKCGNNNSNDLEVHHCKKSFSLLLEEVKNYLPLLDLYNAAMIYTPFWNLNNGIVLCKKCHRKIKNHRNIGKT